MKKLFSAIIFLICLTISVNCFAAGTSTVTASKIQNFARQNSGVSVQITATADATTALFLPAIFDPTTNNTGSYQLVKGSWLTSIKTTPTYPAPTANYDVYLFEKGSTDDFVITSPTLAIGTTNTAVSSIAFTFVIDGVQYAKAAVADGTAPGNDVIPQSKYGAVALQIGANGTIDVVEAAANATGYDSAVLAIAGVAACASDHVRLGYVTATKSDGAFTFGATALNVGNSTVAYTSTIPAFDELGGALNNRSATLAEGGVYPKNSNGDNLYYFIKTPFMVIITGNSVNSAVTVLDLIFN